MKKLVDSDILESIVRKSTCKRDVLRWLKWPVNGNNSRLLSDYISEYNISIEHFDNSKQISRLKSDRKWTDEEMFTPNSKIARRQIRRRFLEISDYICECGNRGFHEGKELTLQLDHINGVNNDHRLENLRWLCPNCHSQTETFAGKNVDYKVKTCCDCGQPVSSKSIRCQLCANKLLGRGKQKLTSTLEELEQLRQTNSMTKIGEMFGVSGNAVKKYILKLKGYTI